MRWLDMIIDLGYQQFSSSTVGSRLPDLGPYSRIGSVFNVVFCAGLIGFALWGWATDQIGAFSGGIALIGVVLEVIFVRTSVRAFRGDFEDFVIPRDDDQEPTDQ